MVELPQPGEGRSRPDRCKVSSYCVARMVRRGFEGGDTVSNGVSPGSIITSHHIASLTIPINLHPLRLRAVGLDEERERKKKLTLENSLIKGLVYFELIRIKDVEDRGGNPWRISKQRAVLLWEDGNKELLKPAGDMANQ